MNKHKKKNLGLKRSFIFFTLHRIFYVIIVKLIIKTSLNCRFQQRKKLASFNNVNYSLMHEAIEIINKGKFSSNGMVQPKKEKNCK